MCHECSCLKNPRDGGAWWAAVYGVSQTWTQLKQFSSSSSPSPASCLVAQSCLTLCNPVGFNPPGSSVHGILQARIWSGLSFSSPGDLLDPGIEPGLPALQAYSLPSQPPGNPPPHLLKRRLLPSPCLLAQSHDLPWPKRY